MFVFFLNDLFSTKIPLEAVVDKKKHVFDMLFTSSPVPPSPPAIPYLSFPIILYTMTFEISERSRSCSPWSIDFLGFFLAACSKVFPKASLSLMKEQVSRLAKSAVVQYVTVFRLILAKRVKH